MIAEAVDGQDVATKADLSELERRLGGQIAVLATTVDVKFQMVDTKFEAMETAMASKFEVMDYRFEAIDTKLTDLGEQLADRIGRACAETETRLFRAYWFGTIGLIVGLASVPHVAEWLFSA